MHGAGSQVLRTLCVVGAWALGRFLCSVGGRQVLCTLYSIGAWALGRFLCDIWHGVGDQGHQADDEDVPEYQACSASVVSGLQKSRCTQWERLWSLTAVAVESSTWCGPVHDVAGGIFVKTYEPAGGPGGSLGSGHAAWTCV